MHQCRLDEGNAVKLFVLRKTGAEPSQSLCRDLNMIKCGNLCCEDI